MHSSKTVVKLYDRKLWYWVFDFLTRLANLKLHLAANYTLNRLALVVPSYQQRNSGLSSALLTPLFPYLLFINSNYLLEFCQCCQDHHLVPVKYIILKNFTYLPAYPLIYSYTWTSMKEMEFNSKELTKSWKSLPRRNINLGFLIINISYWLIFA